MTSHRIHRASGVGEEVLQLHLRRLKALRVILLYPEEVEVREGASMWAVEC